MAGLLMFGDDVAAEITSSIFLTQGYSHTLSICIVVFIAIIPLTKIPLKWVSTYDMISSLRRL
jgi:solute carrier family 32 (vesicular inhibitory amino acid transporter)